jgi:tetratricopeptide (TPR) repeat protein
LDDVNGTGEIYIRLGEIYERRGDLDDALTSYDSAIGNGRSDSGTYYKRGELQEMLGNREAAKKSYSMAASIDERNVRAWERVGTMHLEDDEPLSAKKCLDHALSMDPFDAPSLLGRARLYVREGNDEKAIPIYRTLSNLDDASPEIEGELNALLDKKDEPASEKPIERKAEPTYVPDTKYADLGSTYDMALAAIERAYATGSAVGDDRLLISLGIKGEKREAVLKYLSDIEEYGDIDVDSSEFERMERMSKNVILAEKIDDIDSNPLIGIPAAYIASKAETIDDAKKLIAYIYKAMTDDREPYAFSDDVREAADEASGMSGDITTYNLMGQFNVGVYTARMIGKLSKMGKKGADMHI